MKQAILERLGVYCTTLGLVILFLAAIGSVTWGFMHHPWVMGVVVVLALVVLYSEMWIEEDRS